MTAEQQAAISTGGGHRAGRTKDRPGPGRPTRKQASQRNLQLLDTALDLFLQHGFERTSIDAITALVGMAKRTVYARYPDKLSLFKAALQRAIEEWIVPVEQLRAAETDDLEESLLRVGDILVANILSPAGLRLLRISYAESARLPEIGVYSLREGTEQTLAYLAGLFRKHLSPAGDMPDAADAAQAFLHLVVGGPANMALSGVMLDETAAKKRTRYCVGLFLHGLLDR